MIKDNKKGRKMDSRYFIQSATDAGIKKGIDSIIQMHPRFEKYEKLILDKYIDKGTLGEFINESNREILQYKNNPKELKKAINKFYEDIANGVASGKFFKERGKEFILRKSLEEEAKGGIFRGAKARRILEGEKYLDTTINAFMDLKDLLEQGGYANEMPEVEESIEKMNKMGFANAALDVLKGYNLVERKEYMSLKDKVRKTSEGELHHIKKSLENYIMPEKIAAAALGLAGIGICLTSISGITGNVVGMSSRKGAIGIILGVIIIAIGIILFKKKKNVPEKVAVKKVSKKSKKKKTRRK